MGGAGRVLPASPMQERGQEVVLFHSTVAGAPLSFLFLPIKAQEASRLEKRLFEKTLQMLLAMELLSTSLKNSLRRSFVDGPRGVIYTRG